MIRKWGFLILCCMLCACDAVELENRAFSLALSIDCKDERLIIQAERSDNSVKTGEGKTVAEALHALSKNDKQTLYIGQTKLIVFSENLLSQKQTLHEVAKELGTINDLKSSILVMAAPDVSSIFDEEDSLGVFIEKMAQNNPTETQPLDLESFCQKVYDNQSFLVPKLPVIN